MTGRYLTELGDVLRAAGLVVVEYAGWQTRARGSGGYTSGRPWCVMWHHTASRTSIDNDARYCAEGDPDAPICNALIARDGSVVLIAAGATNTNGKGYAMTFSRGTVPNDQMNTHAVGLEICNDGVGETYPAAQIDTAFAASNAITAAYGLASTDVATHAAWAPDRKIDPATAAAVAGVFDPRASTSSGTWNLEDLRAECAARAGSPAPRPPTPQPPRPVEGDDMLVCALDQNGTAWVGDGVTRFALADPAVFDRYVLVWSGRFLNTSGGLIRGWPDVAVVDELVLAALGRT